MPACDVCLSFLSVSVRPRAKRTVIQLGRCFLESFSCADREKGFEAGNQLWHWFLQRLHTCTETMLMPTLLPTQWCVPQRGKKVGSHLKQKQETPQARKQETKKPRNQEARTARKPRNRETKKLRNQENQKPRDPKPKKPRNLETGGTGC